MKTRFSIRAFLHTRLGALIWTLLVAMVAFNIGQVSNPTHEQLHARSRVTS
jgi:hypothetical protein